MLDCKWSCAAYAAVFLTLCSLTTFCFGLQNDAKFVSCNNIMPGLDKQRLGVDYTRFDPAPLVNVTNSSDFSLGYKAALFDFTCDLGMMWTDTLLNKTYQLPDQLASLYVDSRGYLQTSYANFHSYQEYFSYRKETSNIDADFFGLAGYEESQTYVHLHDEQEEHNRTLTTSYALQSSVVSLFHPYWTLKLGRAAQMYVDKILPPTFDENPSVYCNFVNLYGTHYVSKANFGGIFQAVYTVDSTYKSLYEYSFLEENAKAWLGHAIKVNGGDYSGSEYYNETFVENSKTSIVFYGGVDGYSDGKFNEWWNSVSHVPALYDAELVPIYKLLLRVEAATNATSKSAGLRQASLMYVNKQCQQYF